MGVGQAGVEADMFSVVYPLFTLLRLQGVIHEREETYHCTVLPMEEMESRQRERMCKVLLCRIDGGWVRVEAAALPIVDN